MSLGVGGVSFGQRPFAVQLTFPPPPLEQPSAMPIEATTTTNADLILARARMPSIVCLRSPRDFHGCAVTAQRGPPSRGLGSVTIPGAARAGFSLRRRWRTDRRQGHRPRRPPEPSRALLDDAVPRAHSARSDPRAKYPRARRTAMGSMAGMLEGLHEKRGHRQILAAQRPGHPVASNDPDRG